MASFATASAVVARTDGDCNTGSIQCCASTQTSSITNLALLSSLFGLALPNIGGLLGLSCSPLSILGVGGNSCSQQPVCCTNNDFGGLISLGCSPFNINL
ncbi:fungal hydrophobin [Pluteus cervinus]|uniref:Fungal hydrophobin n=1 Tax=Pluteus cervinus TaxID=181527 RepID=A0ACD3AZ13_9AGAR|nr:fungal hydrophobin [Pluteus cervinus]